MKISIWFFIIDNQDLNILLYIISYAWSSETKIIWLNSAVNTLLVLEKTIKGVNTADAANP